MSLYKNRTDSCAHVRHTSSQVDGQHKTFTLTLFPKSDPPPASIPKPFVECCHMIVVSWHTNTHTQCTPLTVGVSAPLSPSWSVVNLPEVSGRRRRWGEEGETRVALCRSRRLLGECSHVEILAKLHRAWWLQFWCLHVWARVQCLLLAWNVCTHRFLIFQSHYLADYLERCRKLMSYIKSDWFKAPASNWHQKKELTACWEPLIFNIHVVVVIKVDGDRTINDG